LTCLLAKPHTCCARGRCQAKQMQGNFQGSLLRFLSSTSTSSFQTIASTFAVEHDTAPRRLRACCAAATLLEQSKALTTTQRLAAWYIIHDSCGDASLPLSKELKACLVRGVHDTRRLPVERNLVLQLLQGHALEQLKWQTPVEVALSHAAPLLAQAPDCSTLEQLYLAGSSCQVPLPSCGTDLSLQARATATAAAGAVACLPPNPAAAPAATTTTSNGCSTSTPSPRSLSNSSVPGLPASATTSADTTSSGESLATAPSSTPPPPSSSDTSTTSAAAPVLGLPAAAAQVKELVARALKGPLLPAQQQTVLEELERQPGLLRALALTPAHLPALVAHTPALAYELLVRLVAAGSCEAQDWLAVLAAMDMSLHSMEVVNRLTGAVQLPTDFVHLYITNCIRSCEAAQVGVVLGAAGAQPSPAQPSPAQPSPAQPSPAQPSVPDMLHCRVPSLQDKYIQNRLVRLVCVFLQSLIRNRIINIADLLHEVQAFCINFSRIHRTQRLAAWYIIHDSCGDASLPLSKELKACLVRGVHDTRRLPVERNLVLQLLQGHALEQVQLPGTVAILWHRPLTTGKSHRHSRSGRSRSLHSSTPAPLPAQQTSDQPQPAASSLTAHAPCVIPLADLMPPNVLPAAQVACLPPNPAAAPAATTTTSNGCSTSTPSPRSLSNSSVPGLPASATTSADTTSSGESLATAPSSTPPPPSSSDTSTTSAAAPVLGLPAAAAQVKELVARALKGPLLPAQQQTVLEELERQPGLLRALALTPAHLPALVAHTPALAYELLVRLVAAGSCEAQDWLAVLAAMDMSLHSMEVVNRLTGAVQLPTDFVHLYITNCIRSCEAAQPSPAQPSPAQPSPAQPSPAQPSPAQPSPAQPSVPDMLHCRVPSLQDKYIQNRLVRLVCVFLQSLIRNRIINIADLLHEVQAFCINFSRIHRTQRLAAWYIIHDSCGDASLPLSKELKACLVRGVHDTRRLPVERNLVLQLLQGHALEQVQLPGTVAILWHRPLTTGKSHRHSRSGRSRSLHSSTPAPLPAQQTSDQPQPAASSLTAHAPCVIPLADLMPPNVLPAAQVACLPPNPAAAPAATTTTSNGCSTSTPSPRSLSNSSVPGLPASATTSADTTSSGESLAAPSSTPPPPSSSDTSTTSAAAPVLGLPAAAAQVKELVARALKGPLLPAQQQTVLEELERQPGLLRALALTPAHLPALVAHTPALAYELLVRLVAAGSCEAQDWLAVLAAMDMSLHSMEVVNRLTGAVQLPTDFVHLYITNCIRSFEAAQDKYIQNRLVRLVCVFLQSLIPNRIINIADLLHEVQAFCINFSRIREAARLFRLLKQIEPKG
ncbi:hypothetical protein QJQ45_014885, partial [Haematococcus lacustris]